MLDDIDIQNIRDLDDALDCIKKLFNLVETLNQDNQELKRQNQELRDEVNRLKGEQGKPKIKPSKKNPSQYSSEKERKRPKKRKKRRRRKNDALIGDEEDVLGTGQHRVGSVLVSHGVLAFVEFLKRNGRSSSQS